ncbi:hypothetical protein [Labilithrix luteola]|uniref:hypothetical protein n=1 Tax=Labilithrix luteola TaxID=1391654 RepID=UPI0011BA5919|nr:hypothetical protein [Labilithrix luteola]
MKLRSIISVGLVVSMLASLLPRTAHAQEVEAASSSEVKIAESPPDVLALTSKVFASQTADAIARGPISMIHGTPNMIPVRLSRGAKTAIIVGAIVGGVLILAGVLVLSKPGKHI